MTAPTLQEAITAALTAEGHDTFLSNGELEDVARVAAEACDLWRAMTPTVDVPYEPVPPGLTLDGSDLAFADHVLAKSAATVVDQVGALGVLALRFEASSPSGLLPVADVAVLLPADAMRKAGKLLRDSAFGAANAAERAGRS